MKKLYEQKINWETSWYTKFTLGILLLMMGQVGVLSLIYLGPKTLLKRIMCAKKRIWENLGLHVVKNHLPILFIESS